MTGTDLDATAILHIVVSMRTRAGGLAALTFLAALGCGRTQLEEAPGPASPTADADIDIPANIDAVADAPSLDADAGGGDGVIACVDAGAVMRKPTSVPILDPFCGGQVDVAGTSPLGPFIADGVLVSVGTYDCHGNISVNLFTGAITTAGHRPDGLMMVFILKYDGMRRTLAGTSTVIGYLLNGDGSTSIPMPTTVDVTAADDPYGGDGGDFPSMGAPPGQVHVTIDADTGCGHITGTIVAPYCAWNICI